MAVGAWRRTDDIKVRGHNTQVVNGRVTADEKSRDGEVAA
jgi:hypothetical protein